MAIISDYEVGKGILEPLIQYKWEAVFGGLGGVTTRVQLLRVERPEYGTHGWKLLKVAIEEKHYQDLMPAIDIELVKYQRGEHDSDFTVIIICIDPQNGKVIESITLVKCSIASAMFEDTGSDLTLEFRFANCKMGFPL
jgi:hypothetical protein